MHFFYTETLGLYCECEFNDQNVLLMQCFNKLCTTIKHLLEEMKCNVLLDIGSKNHFIQTHNTILQASV